MTVAMILGDKGHDVITASPGDSLGDVCGVLAENRIGAIVIVDSDGGIAGILSERDIVRAAAKDGTNALSKSAREYMTANVVTCTRNETIASIMGKMTAGRFRHVPVVDDGKLIGVISIGDVVKHRIAQAEREAEEMRSYIVG